jgi:very-short-patch-repair endonuclease
MTRRLSARWRELAAQQAGLLARRQLIGLGFAPHYVDRQVAAQRWRPVSEVVVCTTTGVLTRDQLMWAGVLHAGPDSAVGGLTALERRGLQGWHREEITVLLAKSHNLQALDGLRFVETRRPVFLNATGSPPIWRAEPAALLFAAYTPSLRTALGLLAAVVQQRLTTPSRLLVEIERMQPLRRAKRFKQTLALIEGGAQSAAELHVTEMCRAHQLPLPQRQTRRADASGRIRYTDAEWRLPDGRVVVLEVDGGFHMDVAHWEDDMVRERDLVATGAVVLRCTDRELVDESGRVAASLRRVGVGRSSA